MAEHNGFRAVVPAPVHVAIDPGVSFVLTPDTVVVADPTALAVAEYVAATLGVRVADEPGPDGAIALRMAGSRTASTAGPDDEAYTLEVTATGVRLDAATPAGLFRGAQTLRQLVPVEGYGALPGGRVEDAPRYPYRGVMLDVARHFFTVADVRRLIDLAALYKVNQLHLHLSDDQGWRIAIDSWPRLATYGGGTEVGDGPGGYYTKDDFREIVEHAARRFMTVIPEIDLPGHTNAALAAYPELTGEGLPVDRYTGIEVGFSSLAPGLDLTYRFVDDVLGELAALTPGPYLHIGGDEALTLSADDYATLVGRIQDIVVAHGKVPMGWHELATAKTHPSTVLQFWGITGTAPEVLAAAAAGNRVVMSPANRAYLDMRYDEASPLGLDWAGTIGVAASYDWDPATYLPGLPLESVLGVESPLWTETVRSADDLDYLAFPRLPVIAEIGWSPAARHDWADLRARLAAQAPRWDALGVRYHRSPEIDWS